MAANECDDCCLMSTNIEADTAVFRAALAGNVQALRVQLPHRVNQRTAEGYTPLSLAVSAGHADACRLLLREGASVNNADNLGVTALHHACMHGYSGMARMLLLHGANPQAEQAAGQTAAALAAQYGRPSALGTLFRHDASLVDHASSKDRRTALHWAVLSNHVPTAKYLIGCWGGDVSVTDHVGDTPLHLLGPQMEMLYLLMYGTCTLPDLQARNDAGRTPEEAAADRGTLDIAAELRHLRELEESGVDTSIPYSHP